MASRKAKQALEREERALKREKESLARQQNALEREKEEMERQNIASTGCVDAETFTLYDNEQYDTKDLCQPTESGAKDVSTQRKANQASPREERALEREKKSLARQQNSVVATETFTLDDNEGARDMKTQRKAKPDLEREEKALEREKKSLARQQNALESEEEDMERQNTAITGVVDTETFILDDNEQYDSKDLYQPTESHRCVIEVPNDIQKNENLIALLIDMLITPTQASALLEAIINECGGDSSSLNMSYNYAYRHREEVIQEVATENFILNSERCVIEIPNDILKNENLIALMVDMNIEDTQVSAILEALITECGGDPSSLQLPYNLAYRYRGKVIHEVATGVNERLPVLVSDSEGTTKVHGEPKLPICTGPGTAGPHIADSTRSQLKKRNVQDLIASTNSNMVVDGVDVESLNDEELFTRLQALGATCGPIVASTRKIYQKKLMVLMGNDVVDAPQYNGDVDLDEEEEYSDNEEPTEPVQIKVSSTIPNVSARSSIGADVTGSKSTTTTTTTNYTSQYTSAGSPEVRRRVTETTAAAYSPASIGVSFDPERHTPSPRRSLRTVTASSSEIITRKHVINNESSARNVYSEQPAAELKEEVANENEESSKLGLLCRLLVKLILLAVLIIALLYIYQLYQENNPENPMKALEELAKQALEAATGQEIEAGGGGPVPPAAAPPAAAPPVVAPPAAAPPVVVAPPVTAPPAAAPPAQAVPTQ